MKLKTIKKKPLSDVFRDSLPVMNVSDIVVYKLDELNCTSFRTIFGRFAKLLEEEGKGTWRSLSVPEKNEIWVIRTQ